MIRLAYIDGNGIVFKEEKTTVYNSSIHSECIKIDSDIVFDFSKYEYSYLDGKFIEKELIVSPEAQALRTKEHKAELIRNIEVVYKNIVYQGDEISQDRISRAINWIPDDTSTISWKAADNSAQELTRKDLKEILFLAGQEQTRIWFS